MDILDTLKNLYEQRGEEIEHWLGEKRAQAAPFITTSIDLRHSGLRLAPVDTNLFPAGFNNLSPAARSRASRFLARFLADQYPEAKRVLIVPENHTRNAGYLENLATMLVMFEAAGVEVQLGSLAAQSGEPVALEAPSGRALTEFPLVRDGDTIRLENGFTPDLILMNNDMSAGAPALLENIAQPVLPPLSMGWWQRRKGVHFAAYRQLAIEFSRQFGLDPWLISAEFHRCGMIDFKDSEGMGCVVKAIDDVLARIREKHAQYGIADEPYVFVKADSGTYGMGIMTVRSGSEMLELNKKTRNKMQVVKEGTRVSEVIIQEGIPTIDTVGGKPAEPMVYMIDGVPVGGMFRVNGERDTHGNLNAAGMEFTGMCDEVEDECGQWHSVRDCHFRAYGILAAIAALAAAREDYTEGKEGAGI